jgi:hypothetical protein
MSMMSMVFGIVRFALILKIFIKHFKFMFLVVVSFTVQAVGKIHINFYLYYQLPIFMIVLLVWLHLFPFYYIRILTIPGRLC